MRPPGKESELASRLDSACKDRATQLGWGASRSDCPGAALLNQAPPGRLATQRDGSMVARDEEGEAKWGLKALAQVAKEAGIAVKRSQFRTILVREGVRWRHTHSWGRLTRKTLSAIRTAVVSHDTEPRAARRRVKQRPASAR